MIEEALEALRKGKMILLYDFDDREGETDLAICSEFIKPEDILTMRRDGGGLICTAIHHTAAERIGLPFASDVLKITDFAEKEGAIPYDRTNHSSFSLWVNHRDTFTGITDIDRSITAGKIAEHVKAALDGGLLDFSAEFRTPGHMAILRANEALLDKRRGQTELSIALAEMAGVTPAVTICEMLDDTTGKALSKTDAIAYAREHDLIFIEGKDVIKVWKEEKSLSKSQSNIASDAARACQ